MQLNKNIEEKLNKQEILLGKKELVEKIYQIEDSIFLRTLKRFNKNLIRVKIYNVSEISLEGARKKLNVLNYLGDKKITPEDREEWENYTNKLSVKEL